MIASTPKNLCIKYTYKSSNQDFLDGECFIRHIDKFKTLQVWRSKGLLKCDAVDGLCEFNSRLRLPVFGWVWVFSYFLSFLLRQMRAWALSRFDSYPHLRRKGLGKPIRRDCLSFRDGY